MSLETNFVSPDWHRTQEGYNLLTAVMHRGTHKRKPFGLLERPSLPPDLTPDEFEYKIFVSGRSGIGKTSTVAKLSGNDLPTMHSETPGIQTSVVYWPAKMRDLNKVVMFKLQFWDAGENAIKKFSHVLPACKEKADAVMFLFSFVDKLSFEDIPQQMSRVLEPQDNVCKFVLGTKLDLHTQTDVPQREIHEFEVQWKLPVLHMKNMQRPSGTDARSDVYEIAPVLNHVCEELWKRDQRLAGHLTPTVTNNIV